MNFANVCDLPVVQLFIPGPLHPLGNRRVGIELVQMDAEAGHGAGTHIGTAGRHHGGIIPFKDAGGMLKIRYLLEVCFQLLVRTHDRVIPGCVSVGNQLGCRSLLAAIDRA